MPVYTCIPAVLKWCQNDVNFHLSESQYLYSGPVLGPASYEVPLVAGIAPPPVVSSPPRSRAAVAPIHDVTCAGHQCQPRAPLPGERRRTHFIMDYTHTKELREGLINSRYMYMYIYMTFLIIHDMLRKKGKATQRNRKTKQHNTTRPKQSFFKEKSCLGWDLNPRLSAC